MYVCMYKKYAVESEQKKEKHTGRKTREKKRKKKTNEKREEKKRKKIGVVWYT